MALARGDRERIPVQRLLRAVQSNMALLDRANAAPSRDLVFRRKFKTSLAARFASWVRRRPRVFLDGLFLAEDGDRSRMGVGRILHGDLLRRLELVVRTTAPVRDVASARDRVRERDNATA